MMNYHRVGYGLSLLVAVLFLCSSPASPCRADDASGGPVLHLEDAVVVPHGDTISCYGTPVVTSSGGSPTVKNCDIEIHFSVGADGTLRADGIKMTPSPVAVDDIHNFLMGEYVTAGDHSGTLVVSGPVQAPGGRQVYTYVANNVSVNGNTIGNGTWMSGPVEGNPQLPQGVVLPKNFTFGLDTYQNLFGVQQLGDKLLIANFKFVKDGDSGQYVMSGSCILQRKPPQAN